MFLERTDPNPRHGVHLLWAGEKVRPEHLLPAPTIEERLPLEPGKQEFVALPALVTMKVTKQTATRIGFTAVILIEVDLLSRALLPQLAEQNSLAV